MGCSGDHSDGLSIVTVAVAVPTLPSPRSTPAKGRLTEPSPVLRLPLGVIVRSGALLWTSTVTVTSAETDPSDAGAKVVVTVGLTRSLAPIARSETSPLMPPKLNHVRWKPAALCPAGSRQSVLTTSVCVPAVALKWYSNGR